MEQRWEPKPSPRPRLARMLRQWREQSGWSQAEFARNVGLSRNYVSLIEQGRADNPTVGVINAIAAVMGVPSVDVFRWAVIEEVPEDTVWIPVTDPTFVG